MVFPYLLAENEIRFGHAGSELREVFCARRCLGKNVGILALRQFYRLGPLVNVFLQLVNVLYESTASKSDSRRLTDARDYNRSPGSPHVFRVRSDAATVCRVMIFVALLRTGPGSIHLTQRLYGWLDGKAVLTMKVSRHGRTQKLNL